MNTSFTSTVQLEVNPLESRELPTVSALWFSGSMLVLRTDNASTSANVSYDDGLILVRDLSTSRSWYYASSQVSSVEFQGGNGNDHFINFISQLPVRCFGGGGNDYLEGYHGNDYFDGGAGDDTLIGYGGNDLMFGGTGNDILRGMDGDDQLVGQDDSDRLNGGAGNDKMWGGAGDDALIALDEGIGDYLQGDAGRDAYWTDSIRIPFSNITDRVFGATAEDRVHRVTSFANGADRTLNGDRINDPATLPGHTYKTFSGRSLFSASGPSADDIRQGQLNDCWLMAGMAAAAYDGPRSLRLNVVDFDDGTYGVRLGNHFYRVDNDLPVTSSSSSTPAYAQFGRDGSLWPVIVEKAFAHYRNGANSFASLEYGLSVEVNRALGSSVAGARDLAAFSSAAALGNHVYSQWNTYGAVTIGFTGIKKVAAGGAPLVMGHMYTVMNVIRNARGVVTHIVLRNPWGFDGGDSQDANPNDGLVTVTPEQILNHHGQVNWGRI